MSVHEAAQKLQKDVAAIAGIPTIQSILEVICRTTGMGFAAVARVTDEHWMACAVRDEIAFGLQPGDELDLQTTICNEIRQHNRPVVIEHVEKDDKFCNHHTPAQYGFQSYISIPIMRKDGSFFGTLCALDPKPAKINNVQTISMFKIFAELIAYYLDSVDNVASSEARLLLEQNKTELKDQFIAILGHDLRNPIGAILMGADHLLGEEYGEEVKQVAQIMRNSAMRMHGLITNILDFARGRLGSGIALDYENSQSLPFILNQVVAELLTINPGHIINTEIKLDTMVDCDVDRIGQLFSNLLGNAITHGQKDKPIDVVATSDEQYFTLSVSNYGTEIPKETFSRLFLPFYRGDEQPDKKGLGLGLYISSEIAKAHGGEIKVVSTEEKTSFTLQIPVKRPW